MRIRETGWRRLPGVVFALLAVAILPTASAAEPPTPTAPVTNPPSSVVVLGDSISVATGINFLPSVTSPNHSWATGTNAGVNSIYTRMQALNPSVTRHNQASNGRRMNDMANQANAMPANARLVTVQLGGNDLCRDTVEQMPSVEQYRAWFNQGLDAIENRSPNAITMVSSVPDIWNLWFLRGAPNPPNPQPSSRAGTARFFWDTLAVIPCRSLVTNPTSMSEADVQRREEVRMRNIAYNVALQDECVKRLRCRTDNMLTFNFSSNRYDPPFGAYKPVAEWEFVDNDISSVDHFHPSASGQTKLARASWETGYDYSETQPPTLSDVVITPEPDAGGVVSEAPVVKFTYTDLAGMRGIEYRVHHEGQSTGWTELVSLPDTSGEAWTFAPAFEAEIPIVEEGVSWVETRGMDANGNLSSSQVQRVEYHPVTEFHLDLDEGLLDFGPWSGLDPIEDGQEVHLEGTVGEGGQLLLPADLQELPSTTFDLGSDLPSGSVSFEAANNLGGNWNPANGRLTVRGDVRATVSIDGGPTCSTVDTLRFNTDYTQPYAGQRFTGGLEGAGAITASWEDITPFEGDCAALNEFMEGPGGMWLANGIDAPAGAPVSLAAPVLVGTPNAGFRLTCEAGEWSNASRVGAVWTRDGVEFDNSNASGVQRRSYIVDESDIGSQIACYEVGVNELGRTNSDPSNSLVIADSVPVVDQAPVLTTSNGTGNQVVEQWQAGWQLMCQAGSYSNPTDNPWIGITNEWARDGSVFDNISPGGSTRMTYVSSAGDVGSEINCQQTATNIFGSTLAASNSTEIIDG